MNPKVLLTDTTRWPNAARLAIGLSKAGCQVAALCPTHHPLIKTSVVGKTFHYSGFDPLGSLMDAIEATNPQVIIPCDDRTVQHLHELYMRECGTGRSRIEIADLITRSLGAPESYPVVSARYDLIKLACQEGIRTPDTACLNTVDDLKCWYARQALPCVLKADGTSGGRSVRIAHSLVDAERLFLEISRRHEAPQIMKWLLINRDTFCLRPWWNDLRSQITVQSYIPGRPANCAVVCWEGQVLAGISVEVLSTIGATGPATVVRVIDNREMMVAAERIARRLGLSGFFGLDFVIEEGTEAVYLIEMNPRCTPLCHVQLGKGRDLVNALWAQLSGKPVRETAPITRNDTISYFPKALLFQSSFLNSSFHDVPYEEPGLVQELLRPWPERSLLLRAYNLLSRLSRRIQQKNELIRTNEFPGLSTTPSPTPTCVKLNSP